MALYRFKVQFEDYDEVIRIIDIQSTQTFFHLHIAIQDAIGFDKSQMASFYMSDDQWKKGAEITLENMNIAEDFDDESAMPIPSMKDSRLCDYINDPHQKILYVFDFMHMWTFFIELSSIVLHEDSKLKYPVCIKSEGLAPKQYADKKFIAVEDEEFEELTQGILMPEMEEGIDEEDEGLFNNAEDGEEDESAAEPGAEPLDDHF
jgi:hypothetical protein